MESPYLRVVDGQVTDQIEYLSAIVESDFVIAQASAALDRRKVIVDDFVDCRHQSEFTQGELKALIHGCLAAADCICRGIT